jgi:uncharacterized membrane protein YjgN (DUF898 family)
MPGDNTHSTAVFPLQFTGKTGEFFKIWIVNVALSIITLGIYSAWAKVRTRRYFYNNTLLMNSPFDYLGDPIKILKGRLIAVALLILYSVSPSISPLLQGALVVLFLPLLPLIIVKALNFNAYNTAYHNIRFNFKGQYLQALWVFIGLPFVVAITIGLAYPYFTRARKSFIVSNMAYGTCPFKFAATTGQFYIIYLKALVFILALAAVIGTLAYSLMPHINIHSLSTDQAITLVFMIIPVYFLILIIIFSYLYTTITNLVINQTQLAGHHFSSQLQVGKMMWLSFSSMLAIIGSFGLMIPWAITRMVRYRVDSISLHVKGNPEDFIAAETQKVQAIGEEIGDIFDIDVGL